MTKHNVIPVAKLKESCYTTTPNNWTVTITFISGDTYKGASRKHQTKVGNTHLTLNMNLAYAKDNKVFPPEHLYTALQMQTTGAHITILQLRMQNI
jgi:hypothetical protein